MLEDAGRALAAHMGRAEVQLALPPERLQPLERLRQRAQHGVDQMGAGPWRGEDLGEEDPLVDLHALLVSLARLALGQHGGAGRHQAGVALRGGVGQVLDADERAEVIGEVGVDQIAVGAQEAGAHVAHGVLQRLGGGALALVPPGFRRQAPQQRVAQFVIAARRGRVGAQRVGGGDLPLRERRPRLLPPIQIVAREAGGFQNASSAHACHRHVPPSRRLATAG